MSRAYERPDPTKLERPVYHRGSFLPVAPKPNRVAQGTAARYGSPLAPLSSETVGFRAVDRETVVDAIADAGDPAYARALQERYLDFACVGVAMTASRQGRPKPP